MMKKWGQLAISLALTLLVGYLIYRGVPDWGQAWQVMIQGQPLFFLAGFGLAMLHMLLRAVRWGVLLVPVKRDIPLRHLFPLTLIKYTLNIIPPRAGELAASVVLARKEKVSAASVIAVSVLERIFDTMTVMVIFACYLAFFSHRYPPNSDQGTQILHVVQTSSLIGCLLLGGACILIVCLLGNSQWYARLPTKVVKILRPFLEGFRGLQQGGVLLPATLLSLAIWLVITLQLWCMVLAYLQAFPVIGAFFVMALTVVGVAIPTPGGVGGFQFFMNLALVHFFSGYLSSTDPYSQAAGISNGSYLISMGPVVLLGLVFLNREGLSFRQGALEKDDMSSPTSTR